MSNEARTAGVGMLIVSAACREDVVSDIARLGFRLAHVVTGGYLGKYGGEFRKSQKCRVDIVVVAVR